MRQVTDEQKQETKRGEKRSKRSELLTLETTHCLTLNMNTLYNTP